MAEKQAASDNVATSLKGTKLIIEVDLSKTLGPSKSGKTILVGTTRGQKRVEGVDNTFVNLSVYRKDKKDEDA